MPLLMPCAGFWIAGIHLCGAGFWRAGIHPSVLLLLADFGEAHPSKEVILYYNIYILQPRVILRFYGAICTSIGRENKNKNKYEHQIHLGYIFIDIISFFGCDRFLLLVYENARFPF